VPYFSLFFIYSAGPDVCPPFFYSRGRPFFLSFSCFPFGRLPTIVIRSLFRWTEVYIRCNYYYYYQTPWGLFEFFAFLFPPVGGRFILFFNLSTSPPHKVHFTRVPRPSSFHLVYFSWSVSTKSFMGKLIKHQWARLIVLTAGTCNPPPTTTKS
jgi:hypothetical protein